MALRLFMLILVLTYGADILRFLDEVLTNGVIGVWAENPSGTGDDRDYSITAP